MRERLRCLIVDDEPLARELIRHLLAEDPELEVIGECRGAAEAAQAIRQARPDLVFLDVQMPDGSGFEALADLPRAIVPQVIFVTAYDRYALRAFDVNAVDYLLKPFSKERFYESLTRAKEARRQRQMGDLAQQMAALASAYSELSSDRSIAAERAPELVVRQGSSRIAIDPEDIVWIEAADQYSRIHTGSGNHLVSRSLSSFERDLDPRSFFRVHRRALVQGRCVVEVTAEKNGTHSVLLSNGERVPLSRRRRALIPQLLRRAAPRRAPRGER